MHPIVLPCRGFVLWAQLLGAHHPPHTCPALEVFSHKQVNPVSEYYTWSSQEFRSKDKQELEDGDRGRGSELPYDYRYIRFYGKVWEWEGGPCPPDKFACGAFEGFKVQAGLSEAGVRGGGEGGGVRRGDFGGDTVDSEGKDTIEIEGGGVGWSASRCFDVVGGSSGDDDRELGNEEEVCAFVPKPASRLEARFGKKKDGKPGDHEGSDTYRAPRFFSIVTSRSVMVKFARLESERKLKALSTGTGRPEVAYDVVDIPGKEKGAVAARLIRRGEEVMSAAPLIMVDDAAVVGLVRKDLGVLIHEAVQGLLESGMGRYYRNLAGGNVQAATGEQRDMQVFAKNAFKVRVRGLGKNGGERVFHTVFHEVSRVNHDCSPNMGYYFDQDSLTQKVVAARDVHPHEEMTIGYVDLSQPSMARQQLLNESWGFACTCHRCTLPPAQQKEADSRARQIQRLLEQLDDYSSTEPSPEMAELLITLYELEGMRVRIYEAYYRAALEWNGAGSSVKATKYARLCLDSGLMLRSDDSPFLDSMMKLVQSPQQHWSWKFRIALVEKGGSGP